MDRGWRKTQAAPQSAAGQSERVSSTTDRFLHWSLKQEPHSNGVPFTWPFICRNWRQWLRQNGTWERWLSQILPTQTPLTEILCVSLCSFFFNFCPHHTACRITVRQSGIEPAPPTVEAASRLPPPTSAPLPQRRAGLCSPWALTGELSRPHSWSLPSPTASPQTALHQIITCASHGMKILFHSLGFTSIGFMT